jgi:DNA repair protein RecO (recombination protein O)
MMMSDPESHHVYILHSRAYRESSLLADIFSQEEGRYALVIRGAKARKSRYQGLVQPFSPMLVTSYGKGELKTAGAIDFDNRSWRLRGQNLLIGLYVNELLYRLLGKFDQLPSLYGDYEKLLAELEKENFDSACLRVFELSLLANLGYGINFDFDVRTRESVRPGLRYRFVAEDGFHSLGSEVPRENTFAGEHLLDIASGIYAGDSPRILKQVVRKSLQPLLGAKPLKSRSLFEGGD